MIRAIGEILPLAFGVAMSPVPMVAAMVTLSSPKKLASLTGYLVGWAAGVAAMVTAFVLACALLPDEEALANAPIGGSLRVILAGLLALLAVRTWYQRPVPGAEPEPPSWMIEVPLMGPFRAMLLAFLLAVTSPKNLLLAAGAGIAAARVSPGQAVVVGLLVAVIAAAPIGMLAYVYRSTDENGLNPRLERLRRWLTVHSAAILTVLLAVLSMNVLGRGIAAF